MNCSDGSVKYNCTLYITKKIVKLTEFDWKRRNRLLSLNPNWAKLAFYAVELEYPQ